MHLSASLCLLAAGSVFAQGDVGALLQSKPDLSELLRLVSLVPGLNSTLSTASNITILAPTNSAFEAVDRTVPEGMAIADSNSTAIAALLANHVVQGYYPSNTISDIPSWVQTEVTPEYSIDTQPFTSFTGGNYIGLVKNGEDVNVLSGELDVSNVVEADIRLGDGIIIHKIDKAISFNPPFLTWAVRAGYLGFNGALVQSGVSGEIGLDVTGPGDPGRNVSDLTIFVPKDKAFTDIGSILETVDQETLRDVLNYHIIQGNSIFTPQLSNTTVSTVQGEELTFTILDDGTAWVNNAKITFANVPFFNGVAHVIDTVLNPADAPFDRASINPATPADQRKAFPDASSVEELPFSTFSSNDSMVRTYSTAELLQTVMPFAIPNAAAETTGAGATPPAPSVTGDVVAGRSARMGVDVMLAFVAVAVSGVVCVI